MREEPPGLPSAAAGPLCQCRPAFVPVSERAARSQACAALGVALVQIEGRGYSLFKGHEKVDGHYGYSVSGGRRAACGVRRAVSVGQGSGRGLSLSVTGHMPHAACARMSYVT
jgi:hypothetical protein